jgi:hypothetical protein
MLGYLMTINPDGKTRWEYDMGSSIYYSSPAIGSDGTIYLGDGGDDKVYVINPNNTLKWEYKTNYPIFSSPAIGSDGTIYIGSNDNYLHAILDKTPPTITVNPAGGLYNTNMTVTLNTTDPDSTATTYYTLNGSNPQLVSSARLVYNNSTLININQITTLKYSAVDPTGNCNPIYIQTYTITNIPLAVITTDPANYMVNVPNNKVIKITFNEPVTAGSVYNSITVKNSAGALKQMIASISGSVLTLTPVYNYLTGYKYTIYIPANAIKDTTGNGLAADFTSNFTIATIIPSVNSTDPANGVTNISNTKVITITFSEPITPGSAYNSITVKNSGGAVKTMNESISGSVLTLTPVYNYLTGYQYTITIPANAIKDSLGNGLSVEYTSSFTISTT